MEPSPNRQMNRTLPRQILTSLGLSFAVCGLLVIAPLPSAQADDKNKDPDSSEPSGNAPSATGADTDNGTSKTEPTGTPNSARPVNSDGTPADAENLGTVGTGNKGDAAMRNQTNREELDPKITSAWVKGETIPKEYHALLVELPPIERADMEMRYREGRVYYINQNEWKIVRVAELDPGTRVAPLESAFVEGYVVPDQLRAGFTEMPSPDPETSVRVYNNTAYYMDSEGRIIQTMKLAQR